MWRARHPRISTRAGFLSFRRLGAVICLAGFPLVLIGCGEAFWEEFETAYLEASGGPKLSVSVDVQPDLQILSIQSEMDSVVVQSVSVNRENCLPYSKESARSGAEAILAMSMELAALAGQLPAAASLPEDLKFGQAIALYYPDCDILEVSVVTDHGSMRYKFEPGSAW